MQDHNNHEFDAEFIDNSWEKMRQQLDVELPQRRKRRGGLLWWWTGLAAGLMLGLGIMWWLLPTETVNINSLPIPQQSEKVEPTQPITNIQLEQKQNNDNTYPIRESAAIATTKIKQGSGKKHVLSNESSEVNEFKTLTPLASISEANKISEPLKDIGIQGFREELNSNNTTAIIENTTNNEESSQLADSSPITNETRENFPNIPFLHIPELESLNIPASDVALPYYPNRQRNRLRLGAQVATSVNQDLELGYALGVGAEWQFSRRWSVDAGLQYAKRPLVDLNILVNDEKVQIEIVEEPVIAGGSGEIEEEDTASGTINTFEVQDTTYYAPVTTNRYAFLELPIAIQYQFAPRWKIGLGARVGYRLPEMTRSRVGDLSFADPVATDFQDDELSYSNSTYLLPDFVRWRVSPAVSLQYQLSSKLHVRAQYTNYQWLKNTEQQEASNNQNQRGMELLALPSPKNTHEWGVQLRYNF